MNERTENISLEDLADMAQPEAYLFDDGEAPPDLSDLVASKHKAVEKETTPVKNDKDLGLRRITKRRKEDVIPQENPDDPFARQFTSLSQGQELQRLQARVKNQPVVYEKVQKGAHLSELAQLLGLFGGLAGGIAWIAKDRGDYFNELAKLDNATWPSYIPEQVKDIAKNIPWPDDTSQILAIAAGAIIPFLFVYLLIITISLSLRALFARRISLVTPIAVAIVGVIYTFSALGGVDNTIAALIISAGLVLLTQFAESISDRIEHQVRKMIAKRKRGK